MNKSNSHPDAELDALFAALRALRLDTSATEYAFETRLMARLRAVRSTASVWVAVFWRLVPFFVAYVIALTPWHTEVISETNEAEQIAYMVNPDALDAWSDLN